MKKFAVLVVAAMFFAVASPMFAAPFSDVPRTHWAYDAIQKAVDAGILQGYDGKYHGKRLLNRYQMAVIVAKMLDRMGKGAPRGMGGGDIQRMIANLEALTIEFADELALLNVKVSTLEDSFTELQMQVDNMKGGGPAPSGGGGLGFTAFASFGLISTDDVNAGGTLGPLTRYNQVEADQLFFTLPQVSIGVDKEVNEGVFFHAQFDYASDVNSNAYFTGAGVVGINEAYFFLDEMFGDIGGKVGAFALPLSLEHNGPFRTLNYTVTPAAINAINGAWRGYGLELTKVKDVEPGDLIWKFGIVSGTDVRAGGFAGGPIWGDWQSNITALGEVDDSFGYYLQIAKPSQGKGKIGWNLTYFSNGGEPQQTPPPAPSDEMTYFQVGIDWSNDDFYVLLQYVSGDQEVIGNPANDLTAYVILVNFKIDEKQSLSLRYDTLEVEPPVGPSGEFNAITFAYNRKVTDNSMFQFEYLSPEDDTTGFVDEDDDLIQLRYKVHF